MHAKGKSCCEASDICELAFLRRRRMRTRGMCSNVLAVQCSYHDREEGHRRYKEEYSHAQRYSGDLLFPHAGSPNFELSRLLPTYLP